jgi:hypothetical protein
MAAVSKKTLKNDLEKIATQMASIKVLPVAEDDHISVRVTTASFAPRKFSAGKYQVAVGINQALLRLDHPGFERESAYQASLDKKAWSESWNKRISSNMGGGVKANFGKKPFDLIGVSIKGQLEKSKQHGVQQKGSNTYPLITATPIGWQIGTEDGDPRAPDGVLPDGLEHCLSGEYFSARRDEQGEGHTGKNGVLALCVLRPKGGGNDPNITATLFGVSGSLRVAVTLTDRIPALQQSPLKSISETGAQEDSLRKAFIKICVRRAEQAYAEGLPTDAILSGEFYLNADHKHAPKLSPAAASEMPADTKGHRNG